MFEYNQRIYDPLYDTDENRKKTQQLLKKYPTPCISDCPFSWVDEVAELLEKMFQAQPRLQLKQFKEKFGTLRVYYEPSEPLLEDLIAQTETKLRNKGVYI